MIEQDIMKRIMIAVSKVGSRVFRNNVALAWVGQSKRFTRAEHFLAQPGDVLIRGARPLHAGLCKGSSDLIGITPVVVRQEHVGTTIGVFSAFEAKTTTGRVGPEQINFDQQIRALGGISGIVRDDNDALRLIAKYTPSTAAPNRPGQTA